MNTARLRIVVFALSTWMNPLLRGQTAGMLDVSYNPTIEGGLKTSVALQPDGKAVVGGGMAKLVRLNVNGSLDATFTTNVTPASFSSIPVYSVAVQGDGKILFGGNFTAVNGVTRNSLARVNANGTLESVATFNVGFGGSGIINCVAVQADGKILISGGGPTRLNADGSVESVSTFDRGTGVNSAVYCVAVQADGKILLCGDFTTFNGVIRNRIARLNANGSLESSTTFNPGTGANGRVACVALQADGKILIGGGFSQVNGASRRGIARLNPDGSLESTATFNVGGGADFNPDVYCIAVQTDGKILLTGGFTKVNGETRNRIARLNADGSLESTDTFNIGTGAEALVSGVAIQADGKILVGGGFTTFNGVTRNGLVRLNNDAATQILSATDATQVRWMRGGAGAEVSQVNFELSTNGGTSWTVLGSGTRISGGWILTGQSLPVSGSLRARGRSIGGGLNGSSSLIEQLATFTVALTPIQQWKFDTLGNASAPDQGDADFDGLVTLAEYGLALLPQSPSQPPAASVFTYAEGARLRMFVARDPTHNDVSVSVEATGDIVAGPWTALATSSLGAPFTGPGYVGGDDSTPGLKTVEVRDIVNISGTIRRWLRVKVTH